MKASRLAYERAVGEAPGTLDPKPAVPAVPENEAQAREIADYREQAAKDKRAAAGAATTLEQLMAKAKADQTVAELPVLVKADVQGSVEALKGMLAKLPAEEVTISVKSASAGGIRRSVALVDAIQTEPRTLRPRLWGEA